MSIVERALQKAQRKARDDAGRPLMHTEELVSTSPGALESLDPQEISPLTEPNIRRESSHDGLSMTSRDLKAIVQFDTAKLRETGRMPSAELARQVDEEMRRIKWPLLNTIAGRDVERTARNNVVLVTSAVPGEGKTFTSLSLALNIARDREMRVILVDGDVAKPGLTPILGLQGRVGLNDVLEDRSMDVGEVTYQTDVPGLFFVPAGRWSDHSPEYFAGSRMPQVIDELSRRVGNGVIVFDSPPLLATNEAQAVTRYVGQVLMVVRADETEQRAVLDALQLVDKAAIVQAVLNRVTPSFVSRYYGQYYYGYGYGNDGAGSRERPGKGNA
jgi:exopolysaccharide/PEP-CTERM locus tyrosine autokinase